MPRLASILQIVMTFAALAVVTSGIGAAASYSSLNCNVIDSERLSRFSSAGSGANGAAWRTASSAASSSSANPDDERRAAVARAPEASSEKLTFATPSWPARSAAAG